MSGDLPLQMRWCQDASKEKKQLPVDVRGSGTAVLKFPISSSGTFATLLKSVNDVLWVKLDYPHWHRNCSQVISCLVITYACMARDVSNPK